ncbi:MAG: hypothetical protein OEV06_07865 [Anaerolineae bacterium]|nr:hypothetical protein [Anaerolineae bacterium]
MQKIEIIEKLSGFITGELLQNPEYALKEDEALFSNGTIDSFAIAQIGVFVETEFDLYIPDSDLTVENMDTVSQMADRVMAGLSDQD